MLRSLPGCLWALLLVASGLRIAHAGDLLSELSAADARRVRGGEQVMLTEDVDGMPWPRASIYEIVDARPEELMAVFFDYDNATKFVPNCKKSKVAREIDPLTFEVDYEVAVPIVADEAYTVRNTLSRGDDGRYQVDWHVLRATSIKSSEGSFTVEPFGDGSLLRYRNLVQPSSKVAGLLKGMALGQMRDTVTALAAEVEKQRAGDTASLMTQVARLEAALKSN